MTKTLALIALISITNFNIQAKLREYETTRLKSTAGAGVASILMDEATILNPAPIAFFNISSIYMEKTSSDSTDVDDNSLEGTSNYALIASDSSKALKGSISYVDAKSGGEKYKQIATSLAATVGNKSSIGFTYQKMERVDIYQGVKTKADYQQINIGVFHAVNPSFSLGLVAMDILEKSANNNKAVIGAQYQVGNYISLMLDAGADYQEELSERSLWRAAIQFKIMNNFYLRAGMFDDSIDMQSGSGFGLSWIQPKLALNFAIRNIKQEEAPELKQILADVKETSFSVSYRF